MFGRNQACYLVLIFLRRSFGAEIDTPHAHVSPATGGTLLPMNLRVTEAVWKSPETHPLG
jgi:hypothetical protein